METLKGIWEAIKQQIAHPEKESKQLVLIPVRK